MAVCPFPKRRAEAHCTPWHAVMAELAPSRRGWPLWSPKGKPLPAHCFRTVAAPEPEDAGGDAPDWANLILSQDGLKPPPQRANRAERMRRLVHASMERGQLRGRLIDMCQDETPGARARAMAFGESCLLSLALWLRFGSGDFAESLGWVERTDYAAMMALLPGRAVDAATALWRTGRHAAGGETMRQRSVRQTELRAWELGNSSTEAEQELRAAEEAVKLTCAPSEVQALMNHRAQRVMPAGEVLVRQAYERLVVGQQHSLWDLWRKRLSVVQAGLKGDVRPLREALRAVRGFCGPDMDNEHDAWTLAVDLTTVTPFTSDGPVTQYGDYAAFLRRRQLKQCCPAAQLSARASVGVQLPRARPPTSVPGSLQPDLTGLPI